MKQKYNTLVIKYKLESGEIKTLNINRNFIPTLFISDEQINAMIPEVYTKIISVKSVQK